MNRKNFFAILLPFLSLITGCSGGGSESLLDYYDNKLFYVDIYSETTNKIVDSGEFFLDATFYSKSGENEERQFAPVQTSSASRYLFYLISVPSSFYGASFKVKDKLGNHFLESYITNLQKFKKYRLSYKNSWQYDYSGCLWMDAYISVDTFCFLLSEHSENNKNDYLLGPESYPNLLNSFFVHFSDKEISSLHERIISFEGGSYSAFTAWGIVKNNFLAFQNGK